MDITTQALKGATSTKGAAPLAPPHMYLVFTLRSREGMWSGEAIFAAAEAAGFREQGDFDMVLIDATTGNPAGRIKRSELRGLKAFTRRSDSVQVVLNPADIEEVASGDLVHSAGTMPHLERLVFALNVMAEQLNADIVDGAGKVITAQAWLAIRNDLLGVIMRNEDARVERERLTGDRDQIPLEALMRRVQRAASGWWTLLSEMRFHGQLPDWVLTGHPGAGTNEAMEAYRANWELLTQNLIYDGALPEVRYALGETLDDGVHALEDKILGERVFSGSAIDLAATVDAAALDELSPRQLSNLARAMRREAQALAASVAQIGGAA